MLLKKINKSIQNISKRKLSIQFSLDGFSFCISNFEHTIYHYTAYQFDEKVTTPEALLKEIEDIFQNDRDLHDDFESVVVVHQNNLSTFVPNEYFKEDDLKSYLNFNVKTLSTDFIASDDIDVMDAKNVYVPYVNINNFLFQNFGEFEYKHHATVLVEKLISRIRNSEIHDVQFFANVSDSTFDIVVIQDQKLEFYNCFEYNTPEDFIYYILFTYEQLELDPSEVALNVTGSIEEGSDLYNMAYTYIKDISFVITFMLLHQGESVESYSNYILLG